MWVIVSRHSREGGNLYQVFSRDTNTVTHVGDSVWIPAFAGMTNEGTEITVEHKGMTAEGGEIKSI